MKIIVGADHGGFELKEKIAARLRGKGIEVEDAGTHGPESVDYPRYAAKVAEAVASGRADRGVLVCGTGIGMCITANRFEGVRAALVSDAFSARMSRRHNDANVLCLGGRTLGDAAALDILDIWLSEPFDGGRHERRVNLIEELANHRDKA